MRKYSHYILAIVLLLIPLYPKFPLFGVSNTFVSIRIEDVVLGLFYLYYAVYLIRQKFKLFRQPIPRSVLLFWWVGAVAAFSGIFLTKTAGLNLGILHTLRRVEYMTALFLGLEFLQSKIQLRFLIRVLLVVAVIVSIFGLGQMYLNFPVISTNNSEFSKGLALQLGPGARINSTFAGHYDLAAFTALPLLLILALFPMSKNKAVLALIWGVTYWTLLMSASRVTFASFFISAAVLVIVIGKKFWLVPLFIAAFAGIMISPQLRGRYLELLKNHFRVTLVSSVYAEAPATVSAQNKAVDTIPEALQPQSEQEDRSLNIRLNVEWPRALRSLIKNPLLGTGYSSVGLAVDNEYLRILAETGILGLLSFILILLRYFKTSLPFFLRYQPGPESAFIVSVSCFLISLLLGGLFIDVFTASKVAIIAWTVLGLSEKVKTFTND